MTQREKAICEVFTGICFFAGEQRRDVYEYASELLGRPIYTHEFYTLKEGLKEKARADFVAICQNTTEPDIVKRLVKERDYWKEEALEARKESLQHKCLSNTEAFMHFIKALDAEVSAAIRSNEAVIRERVEKRGADRLTDPLCCSCNGKILALDGISGFIDHLVEEMTDGGSEQ